MSRNRRKVSYRGGKKLFTGTARNVHPRNLLGAPMRGGIRF